ncbi:large ribosomal subunit protein uL10m [Lampetra fluviatilis]
MGSADVVGGDAWWGGLLPRSKMATFTRSGLAWARGWVPRLEFVRNARAVTRHKRPIPHLKQKVLELTKVITPKPLVPLKCIKSADVMEEKNKLEMLLEREVEKLFRENRMVTICQLGPMKDEDWVMFRHHLRKHDIYAKIFPNKVVQYFLNDSKYKNLKPLFICHNVLVVSHEPRVRELLRVLRAVPQVILLGGCVDDVLMSKQSLLDYSKLPKLEVLQSQLVGTLSHVCSQTSSVLQQPAQNLTQIFQQHISQQTTEPKPDESS